MGNEHEQAFALIKGQPNCHVATVVDGQPWQRVMSTARVDADFTFWFATFTGSTKLKHIAANPQVSLSYWSDAGDIHVCGKAELVDDIAMKEELWDDTWLQYFPDGAGDSSLVLLKVTPSSVGFRPSGEVMEMVELLG